MSKISQTISNKFRRLSHHRTFRALIARVGYHPVVERAITKLQIDRLIHRVLFPMEPDIQVMGNQIEWTLPNIYGYLNVDYEANSDTWLEGYYSKRFAQEIKSGDVVYDVGARWGYQSLVASFAAGDTGSVIAFEPYPPHRHTLQTTIEKNDLPAAVRTEAFAFGDKTQTVEFDLSRNEHSPQLNPNNETSREVAMVTLDAFVETNESPDIIDIDIEGAELLLLRGAKETLRTHKPTIFLEIHDREMVVGEWEDIYALLFELEYELELVEGEESRIVEAPPDSGGSHDLIARPQSD